MKILVTGGAGFIGSNLVRYLLENTNHSVVNYDLLTYAAHPMNLEELAGQERYAFVRGDVCDGETFRNTMKEHGVEAVIHCAAESHVDRSILDASAFVQTNILGTQTLVDVCRELEIQKFVHVSTDEVYGSLSFEDPAFTEETAIKPNSPYAASKAASDHLVLAASRTYGFPAVITRCSNNYGPRQFPEKLIPLVIHRASTDQSIPIYGDGKNVRDWIFVTDHCAGIVSALESGKTGQVYNFGGEAEKANIDLVRMILEILGKPESLMTFVKDRLGHDRRYAINFAKAESELNWKPQVEFHEGLAQTVKWYQDNAEWVGRATDEDFEAYFKTQYEGS